MLISLLFLFQLYQWCLVVMLSLIPIRSSFSRLLLRHCSRSLISPSFLIHLHLHSPAHALRRSHPPPNGPLPTREPTKSDQVCVRIHLWSGGSAASGVAWGGYGISRKQEQYSHLILFALAKWESEMIVPSKHIRHRFWRTEYTCKHHATRNMNEEHPPRRK